MDEFIALKETRPAFICVAGDNYYPEVVGKGADKKKYLSIPDLRSGFACLSEFQKRHDGIPIDIIAGNHDTEKTIDMIIDRSSPSSGEHDQCLITTAEIQASSTMNFTMFYHRVIGNTLVIMIDSNIYEETLKDPVELNCYEIFLKHTLTKLNLRKLYDGSPPIKDVGQLKAIQLAWLDHMYETIGTHNFTNVVIVAHHPLASYKIKGEECRFPIVKPDYLDFCYGIYTHLREVNKSLHFFYSCADLHTYQSGTVTIHHASGAITISQEIAGTGGTELEDAHANMKLCPPMRKSELVVYEMTKIYHNHGFLHWSIDSVSGKLAATFIPIDSDLSASGSGRASASGSSGGTKRRRQRASKRRRQRTSNRRKQRTFKRGRHMRRSRSMSRSRH
jgi:hypothetical protein